MKKVFSVVIVAVMMTILLIGCGNKEDDIKIQVGALKGPTSMGMVNMIDKENYNIDIVGAPDELTPKIVKGDIDIAAVPSNLASVIYNNTEGKIQVLAVNTLGVLYMVQNGETVKSLDDLKGKTIYASGKGAVPEYTLNYLLKSNNLDKDVKIEYKSEHSECLSAILNDEDAVAMLPEPFVTIAKQKNKDINTVIDINKEWENNNGQIGRAHV